jgi:protoporphyrin/coproporphyrin ferrochelatase
VNEGEGIIFCFELEALMKALLLLAFGGPRSLAEVEPFLARLFKGRRPSKEVLERVKERYRLIGGASPLLKITQGQAKALEKRLSEKGYSFKSYVGMRYGHPSIEETMKEILGEGIPEVVAVPMAPFQSRESSGAYIEEVKRVQKDVGELLKVSFVVGWHRHPLFLEAIREKVREGLMGFTPEERARVHLLFTAHSLPKSVVEKDPYAREIEETIQGVVGGLEHRAWRMAYQSKGGGTEEWVGPDVESVLTDLSKEGVQKVLVVPIGFVSDHIEILYDIDIVYREKAKTLGMKLRRTTSLNFSEKFIEALSAIVEEHLEGLRDPGLLVG